MEGITQSDRRSISLHRISKDSAIKEKENLSSVAAVLRWAINEVLK